MALFQDLSLSRDFVSELYLSIFKIREGNGRSRRDSHGLTHMAFMGYLSA